MNVSTAAIRGVEEELERLRSALDRILDWCDAYPATIFTDQDLVRANVVLAEAGISMTAMHGQWGREIMAGIRAIAAAATDE